MESTDIILPFYLYSETCDSDGAVNRITYAADKLVAWADHGRDDAVEKHCRQILEKEIAGIQNWQEEQFLLLDESWAAVEKGWDDDDNEQQYEIACDAVRSEAKEKCEAATLRMERHKAAIRELVREARKTMAEHAPVHAQGGSGGVVLALTVLGVLVWILG